MKPHYYIHNPSRHCPLSKPHPSIHVAEEEATRLAALHPEQTFEILQVIGSVTAPKPQPIVTWVKGVEEAEDKPEGKLQLEVGKRYVRRDGKVTGPLKGNRDGVYSFWDGLLARTYTPNGRYNVNTVSDPCDLVREYVEETGVVS